MHNITSKIYIKYKAQQQYKTEDAETKALKT